jgi:RimJ/RimL family protein N-acetyltransferase
MATSDVPMASAPDPQGVRALPTPFEWTEPVRTARLTLRPLGPDDLDDVHAYQSRADVCEYLLFEPRTREEVLARLDRYAVATRLAVDGDFLQLALVLDSDGTSRVIGDSYFTIHSVEHMTGEIGWTMHPDFGGQGFAFEAASAVLDRIAFGVLALHRVRADLDPRNEASIRLCRRLGMREEARFVEDLWFKGEWADTGIFAILDREWRARR